MAIKTLEELGAIASLCRKQGIQTIRITEDSVEFTLAPPQKRTRKKKDNTPQSADIQTDPQLTEEDILFYSSAGIPDSALGKN